MGQARVADRRVIDSTSGIVGDLQAIAGGSMPQISNLDIPLLEDSAEGAGEAG